MCVWVSSPDKLESSLEARKNEKCAPLAPICCPFPRDLFPTRGICRSLSPIEKSWCGACQENQCQGAGWATVSRAGGIRRGWHPQEQKDAGILISKACLDYGYESLERRCTDWRSFVCVGRLRFQTKHIFIC